MTEPNRVWAIMGVDPGMTTGVSQMHVFQGKRPRKVADHAVGRFAAWEMPVRRESGALRERQRRENEKFALRGVNPSGVYGPYLEHAHEIVTEWMAFRYSATAGFGIPPWQVMMAIEDYTFGNTKDTRREAMSPVFIAHQMLGILEGIARVCETNGFGPGHVGSVFFLQPAEKATWREDEKLERLGLLMKDTSKSKRGRVMEHANDASRLALALARKIPVPELGAPFSGPRPAPSRRVPVREGIPGPFHLAGAYTYEPGDATPALPSRAKARARAGQEALAEQRADDNSLNSTMARLYLTPYPDLVTYIMSRAGKPLVEADTRAFMNEDAHPGFWRLVADPSKGWTKRRKNVPIPGPRLLQLCQKVAGASGLRSRRREESLD